MMVYEFNKGDVSPYKAMCEKNYVVKTQRKTSYASLIVFLSMFTVLICVPFSSADAIGTTKASALVLEKTSLGVPLSYKDNSPTAQADPCLLFLHAFRPSLGASASSHTRRLVGKTTVPIALSLVLGVRIALGPKEVVKSSKRVQIGPEIRTGRLASGNHALAIAAYRSCKNEHFLGLLKNKNNKKQVMK